MRNSIRRGISLCAAAAVLAYGLHGSAYAHNSHVHMDMTETAYEVMKIVESPGSPPPGLTQQEWKSVLAPPDGVPASEWQKFLNEIKAAAPKLRGLPSNLPEPVMSTCAQDVNGSKIPAAMWWNQNMGEVANPVSAAYITGDDCGIRYGWSPGGIFDTTNSNKFGHRDHTGTVLGFWAQNVDDEMNDTHLWVRPQNALGFSAVKKEIEEAGAEGLGILLIPVVCLGSCLFGLFGTCKKCVSEAKKIGKEGAEDLDPIGHWLNSVPGIGDETGGDYVTMWHFINMQSGLSNEFDDRQGLFYEEAGLNKFPDAVDVAIMAFFDLTGLSINAAESKGVTNYQITTSKNPNDAHQLTVSRDEADWQKYSAAHVPFEPIDNLGFFGWQTFRDSPDHPSKFLGWPLHAIGDATSPMHVIGSSGWGHRPFEDAVDHLFPKITEITGTLPTHADEIKTYLERAFAWRNFILQWRKENPGHDKDIPVRNLVTALAQNTLDYSKDISSTSRTNWPFIPGTSLAYLTSKDIATSVYENPEMIRRVKPLIRNGIGAKIAFLTFATEVIK
ncbi:MAG: hypothetical protein ACLGJB_25235 [Blastocatellia bacterium]